MKPSVRVGWRGGWTAFAITLVARQTLALVVALVLVTLVPAAFGWHSTVVSSGSMGPRVQVGDVAVSRPLGGMPLRLGQVLLVHDPDHPGRLRLHRFVGSTGDGHLITRGDRNAADDSSPVPIDGVVGIAVLRVPWLGLPAVWIGSGRVPEVLGVLGALLAILAGTVLFRPDAAGRRPPLLTAIRRRRATRVAAGAVALTALVGVLPTTAPPSFAAYTAQTSTTGTAFAATSRYRCADRVLGDAPVAYYPLSERSGTTAADLSGSNRPGTYSSTGITYGVTGPCSGDGATAVTLNGGSSTGITTAALAPRPAAFTVETWLRTTTTTGGTLLGIFDSVGGSAGQRDPIVYLTDAGRVTLRMHDPVRGTSIGLTSPTAINDGSWHLVGASFGSGVATLFVDGAAVASGPIDWQNTAAGSFRIGYGSAAGWADSPTSQGFTGSLAGAALFASRLTATQVANEYGSRARSCADVGVSDGASAYYRLSEASGTAAADASGNGSTGTYAASGITYGVAGPCPGDGSTGVGLSGAAGVGVTGKTALPHPATLSTEVRFKTTTTTGGLLVGFYGAGTAYDFILYLRDNGGVSGGVWNPAAGRSIVASSPNGTAYNDGRWHVASFTYSSSAGSAVYIDGVLRATAAASPTTDTYTGAWHIGYGQTTGWAGRPTSTALAGSVSAVGIFPRALTASEVAAHAAAL